jgi:probable rRNA maturation factor
MISFSAVETKFKLKNRVNIKNWIRSILETEHKKSGDIAYVFCTDTYLLEMNKHYLKHDTLTDIITFDYSEKGFLSGDIFISIDRVKENAVSFNTTFDAELGRVMAHGVLHLSGYKDKTPDDKKEMRAKEDYYLTSFPSL